MHPLWRFAGPMAGLGHGSSEGRDLDVPSSCSADVWHAIESEGCPDHGDKIWFTATSATSPLISEASDQVIVLSKPHLGAANGNFHRCGKALHRLRQNGSEHDAGNGNGCSEHEDVRSEGHEEYWRRHYREVVWLSGLIERFDRRKCESWFRRTVLCLSS